LQVSPNGFCSFGVPELTVKPNDSQLYLAIILALSSLVKGMFASLNTGASFNPPQAKSKATWDGLQIRAIGFINFFLQGFLR
jgi:hypothetical protein